MSDRDKFSETGLVRELRTASLADIVCAIGEFDVPLHSANPLLAACLDEMLVRAKGERYFGAHIDAAKDMMEADYWVDVFSTWWSMDPYNGYVAFKRDELDEL